MTGLNPEAETVIAARAARLARRVRSLRDAMDAARALEAAHPGAVVRAAELRGGWGLDATLGAMAVTGNPGEVADWLAAGESVPRAVE